MYVLLARERCCDGNCSSFSLVEHTSRRREEEHRMRDGGQEEEMRSSLSGC